jgi:hypothetical protein
MALKKPSSSVTALQRFAGEGVFRTRRPCTIPLKRKVRTRVLVPRILENEKGHPCGQPFLFSVREKGLEPPRREAPDPKSGAATNYATPASQDFRGCKDNFFAVISLIIFI